MCNVINRSNPQLLSTRTNPSTYPLFLHLPQPTPAVIGAGKGCSLDGSPVTDRVFVQSHKIFHLELVKACAQNKLYDFIAAVSVAVTLAFAHVWQVWDGAESGRCLGVYTCHSGAVRDACWTPCGRRLLTGSFDNRAVITDVETGE